MTADDLGSWDPLSPDDASQLFAAIDAPWWVAGGWAIDLHIGQQTRQHGDLDVLILRPDQWLFRSHLRGWDVHAADPPGSLRPWVVGETLPPHVHDVWCRPHPTSPWSFQFMIDDVDGDDWLFRRDHTIRRPITTLAGRASDGRRRVLTPEVQLLYKSRGMRDKDRADFESVLVHLTLEQRDWLRGALQSTRPDHPWIDRLRSG